MAMSVPKAPGVSQMMKDGARVSKNIECEGMTGGLIVKPAGSDHQVLPHVFSYGDTTFSASGKETKWNNPEPILMDE